MSKSRRKDYESIFLSLGSNMGERDQFLKKAIRLIGEKAPVAVSSSVYETEPWGFDSADFFLNLVIEIKTGMSPEDLLHLIHSVESELGRTRSDGEYQSRVIDIDVLFYGRLVMNTAGLIIPHPLIAKRRFVLVPLDEIASGFIHPVLHKTVSRLLKECPDQSSVKKV